MPLAIPKPLMLLSLRYMSVVSLFGLLFVPNSSRHYLNRTIDKIRPGYGFDETCQGSVPESIIAFLESESFEDAVRRAVSLDGDADTQGAIAGSIAEAFYGIPEDLKVEVKGKLPSDMRTVLLRFNKEKFPKSH